MKNALVLTGLILAAALSSCAQTLSCPASIKVSEHPTTLHTATVLNIDGKNEFDLKPDDEHSAGVKTILVWNLDDYRDHDLFLRCSYRDSSIKLTIQLPRSVHHCSATLTITRKNEINGVSSAECK